MIKKILTLILLVNVYNHCFAKIANYKDISKDFKIKVRIEKHQDSVTISGTDLTRFLHPLNESKTFAGRKKITFKCSEISNINSKSNKSVLLATINSSTGLVSVGSSKYHGAIHIITSDDKKSCDVINELDMDIYIGSLLSKEMNSSWPLEALKAQAIAARTYAMYQMSKSKLQENSFYDLESSEKHQVTGDFFDVTVRTLKAARETSGMLLTNDFGEVIPAFFHASCGGTTLNPESVWSSPVRGYKRAHCDYCSKKENWSNSISKVRIQEFVSWLEDKMTLSKFRNMDEIVIYPNKLESTEIILSVDRKKFGIKKSFFRRYFGRVLFPSNNFQLTSGLIDEDVNFAGKGNGHGVGLCQVGAKGLADKGWDYKKIISHYYPLLKLTTTF